MTNGLVLVLGACGRNFAAGMSGGIAYVFDERMDFTAKRCNLESVDLEPLLDVQDVQIVRELIKRHIELTGSRRANWILDNWQEAVSRFIKVFPHEFKRVLGVGRSERAYIPANSVSAPVSVFADAEQVQNEAVQHG
jgi:glutamate synthase (NADPH/NADH) large chain